MKKKNCTVTFFYAVGHGPPFFSYLRSVERHAFRVQASGSVWAAKSLFIILNVLNYKMVSYRTEL